MLPLRRVQKGEKPMNRWTTGLLVAVVAVVSSVIVVLRAEKPRRYVQARFERVRGVMPKPQQVRQGTQQLAARASHLVLDAKETTQQAINKGKQAGSNLAEKTKQLTVVGRQNGR